MDLGFRLGLDNSVLFIIISRYSRNSSSLLRGRKQTSLFPLPVTNSPSIRNGHSDQRNFPLLGIPALCTPWKHRSRIEHFVSRVKQKPVGHIAKYTPPPCSARMLGVILVLREDEGDDVGGDLHSTDVKKTEIHKLSKPTEVNQSEASIHVI